MPFEPGVPFFDFIDMMIAGALGGMMVALMNAIGARDWRAFAIFLAMIVILIALLISRYTGATA